MKKLFVLIACAAIGTIKGQGDEVGEGPAPRTDACVAECMTTEILLNTGYNHKFSMLYSPVRGDGYWHVKHDPVNGPVDKCAWVINPASSWPVQYSGSPLPNSRWISLVPSSSYNVVNATLSHCDLVAGPVTFERKFHVCGLDPVNVDIFFEYYVDDYLHDIRLDGVSFQTYNVWSPACHVEYGIGALNITLSPGTHVLSFDVYNTDAVDFGFNLAGSVQATNGHLTMERCFQEKECEVQAGPPGNHRITGMNEALSSERVIIFPNPSADVFQFNQRVEKIIVTDLLGREILRMSDVVEVSAQNWEVGTYLIRIENNGSVDYKKVMKE